MLGSCSTSQAFKPHKRTSHSTHRAPVSNARPSRTLTTASSSADGAASTSSPSCSSVPLTNRRGALLAAAVMAVTFPSFAAQANTAPEVPERAIEEYTAADAKGKFAKDRKALEDFREKYKFRRGLDGRVFVKTKKGQWLNVRLDMEVPGALLFRDEQGFISASQSSSLLQVDLSDDLVVLALFADGSWEEGVSPVEFANEKGGVKQLQLSEQDFRNVVGLLNSVEEAEEEAAADGKEKK